MKFLVINGPNLNMLGIREPDIYGRKTYSDLEHYLYSKALDMGIDINIVQSNHEGAIVEFIQEAYGVYDGIVINPAAYTHTSVAILDALKAVAIPAAEIHISKVSDREDFRQVSYIRSACIGTFEGKGFDSYVEGMKALKEHLSAL